MYKHVVVVRGIVQQEAKMAGAISMVQMTLAGLGAERLCSTLECVEMGPKTMPNGFHDDRQATSVQSL